jgi:hypothetical protein
VIKILLRVFFLENLIKLPDFSRLSVRRKRKIKTTENCRSENGLEFHGGKYKILKLRASVRGLNFGKPGGPDYFL